MNLLENYIREVYSEEVYEYQGIKYVKAEALIDCYGSIQRKIIDYMTLNEWEQAKTKGYYMA